MKAHRQGHGTTHLLRLLSPEIVYHMNYGFSEYRKTLSRIQGNSLLIHDQRVILVPELNKLPLPWTGGIDICLHIQYRSMSDLHMGGIQVPYADNITEYTNRQGIISCRYCFADFRFDLRTIRG